MQPGIVDARAFSNRIPRRFADTQHCFEGEGTVVDASVFICREFYRGELKLLHGSGRVPARGTEGMYTSLDRQKTSAGVGFQHFGKTMSILGTMLFDYILVFK